MNVLVAAHVPVTAWRAAILWSLSGGAQAGGFRAENPGLYYEIDK